MDIHISRLRPNIWMRSTRLETRTGRSLRHFYLYGFSQSLYRVYVERGAKADKEKKALLGAATKVIDLTKHIGTEIVGLQLKDLTEQQRDELALLIAERSVVFFRDQDISPQEQRKLGKYYGEVEVHVSNIKIKFYSWLIVAFIAPSPSSP